MQKKDGKPGVTRRDLFKTLVNRAATEVKEGYKEGLAEQTAKNAAKHKPR